jgi:hypothetical protein
MHHFGSILRQVDAFSSSYFTSYCGHQSYYYKDKTGLIIKNHPRRPNLEGKRKTQKRHTGFESFPKAIDKRKHYCSTLSSLFGQLGDDYESSSTNEIGTDATTPEESQAQQAQTSLQTQPQMQTCPYAQLYDPATNCHIFLLGCLHGSESSGQDVLDLLHSPPVLQLEHWVASNNTKNSTYTQTSDDENYANHPGVDAIVLELCATRFQDLVRSMSKSLSQQQQESSNTEEQREYDLQLLQPGKQWTTYPTLLKRTVERRGLSSGIAATVLGGFSAFQGVFLNNGNNGRRGRGNQERVLNDHDELEGAGLEFQIAIQYAQQKSQQSSSSSSANSNAVDLVLADREVTETLQRLGQLPKVSWNLLTGPNAMDEIQTEIINFRTALWGDNGNGTDHLGTQNNPAFVNVGNVILRNADAVRDLLQLAIVPLLVASVTLLTLASTGLGLGLGFQPSSWMVLSDLSSTLSSTDLQSLAVSITEEAIMDVIVLGLSFVVLALPVTKVILTERDVQLAKGVQDACQLVFARQRRKQDGLLDQSENPVQCSQDTSDENSGSISSGGSPSVVVAVLGLLHVNGVSKLLLESFQHGEVKNTGTVTSL